MSVEEGDRQKGFDCPDELMKRLGDERSDAPTAWICHNVLAFELIGSQKDGVHLHPTSFDLAVLGTRPLGAWSEKRLTDS